MLRGVKLMLTAALAVCGRATPTLDRVDSSLDSLFAYWWRDSAPKQQTGFFFACGLAGCQ